KVSSMAVSLIVSKRSAPWAVESGTPASGSIRLRRRVQFLDTDDVQQRAVFDSVEDAAGRVGSHPDVHASAQDQYKVGVIDVECAAVRQVDAERDEGARSEQFRHFFGAHSILVLPLQWWHVVTALA